MHYTHGLRIKGHILGKGNNGQLSVPIILVCAILLVCGAVAVKEYGKWKKKADAQQAILVAAEAAKAKVAADVAAYELAKATHKASVLALRPALDEFSDALQVAKSTGRIALPTPVLSMQKAYRRFQDLQTTECLSVAKKSVEEWMRYSILGFTEFMQENRDTVISMSTVHFAAAAKADARAAEEFEACAPKPPEPETPLKQ